MTKMIDKGDLPKVREVKQAVQRFLIGLNVASGIGANKEATAHAVHLKCSTENAARKLRARKVPDQIDGVEIIIDLPTGIPQKRDLPGFNN